MKEVPFLSKFVCKRVSCWTLGGASSYNTFLSAPLGCDQSAGWDVLFVEFCRTGVFSLTQEYGLQFILNCKKPGFHPHPKEPPLYQVSVVVLYTFSLYCYSYSHLSQSIFQSLTSKWSIAFLSLHRKEMNELLLTMASTLNSRNLSTKMLSFY